MSPRLILPAVLLLVSGCASLSVMSHVPMSTMRRLAALKPADIEPAQIRVAARMPEIIEPRSDGVMLFVTVGQVAPAPMRFVLEPAPEPQELAPLAPFQRPTTRTWNYRLAAADVLRLQQVMARATGTGVQSVSISASVEACRRADLRGQPLPTTTFLKTDAGSYLVLLENIDLRSVASEDDLEAKVPDCAVGPEGPRRDH